MRTPMMKDKPKAHIITSDTLYMHTQDHIYLQYFNDEIILLDIQKNKYVVFTKDLAEVLLTILKKGVILKNGRILSATTGQMDLTDQINTLHTLNIFSSGFYKTPSSLSLIKKPIIPGQANVDWRLQQGDLEGKVSKRLVLYFYYLLIKVHLIVKFFGFQALINIILRNKAKGTQFKDQDPKEFSELAAALNRACFYFPIRTKCLEWAAALTLMALKKKWCCNLEIGAQTVPFQAHAWVNANGSIIADVQDLPQNLAVVLSEPF